LGGWELLPLKLNRELGHGESEVERFFFCLRCFELRKLTFVNGEEGFGALRRCFEKKAIFESHHLTFSVFPPIDKKSIEGKFKKIILKICYTFMFQHVHEPTYTQEK